MRILIKGAGDLATGIAVMLYREGHDIVMTEIEVPLTVRRTVAFSRAVYEGEAIVEGIRGVKTDSGDGAEKIIAGRQIAVIVDEKAKILKEYHPDVLVDAVMAKKNLGTDIADAPCVIGVGPGFTAGEDCHCVIETVRGESMGNLIFDGSAIPDTGIPGKVGGYTKERLLRAESDGKMVPRKDIGDYVQKGQVVAETGGIPVFAQITGIVRGMLQKDVIVRKGMKIGDIHPGTDVQCCFHISDKAEKVGKGVCEAVEFLMRKDYGIVLLAAGKGERFGGEKLLYPVGTKPMYSHILQKMKVFPAVWKGIVTGHPQIERDAQNMGVCVVANKFPEKGISYSVQEGLRRCLQDCPKIKRVLFAVCDQPGLNAGTLYRLLSLAERSGDKIVCAGYGGNPGNPVVWNRKYFKELLELTGDAGGRQLMKKYPSEVLLCEITEAELKDIDTKDDLCNYKDLPQYLG